MKEIKAYRVTSKWVDMPTITGATTAGKAIQSNLASAQFVGYGAKFTDFKARRAPEYDAWIVKQSRPSTPFGEDYAKKTMVQQ